MPNREVSFREEEIQALFGHEAAEDEDPARLRQYYFKSQTFAQIAADVNIRVLVGHKGIGKSALFQVAMAEDREAGRLAVELRPDDVLEVGATAADFLSRIAAWKSGLTRILTDKIVESFKIERPAFSANVGDWINTLRRVLKPALDKIVDSTALHPSALRAFAEGRELTVYIDDLDRGWEGRREDIIRISALLNAARDLVKTNPGLRFRIALRSDVYFLVRTSDESTDKIEGSVIWHSWTNHEILALLVKRIRTYFGQRAEEAELLAQRQSELALSLDVVCEEQFLGRGHWSNTPMYRVFMSLIRRRPRDLVKLLTLGAREAAADRSRRIGTPHLEAVFPSYSQGRVQDTINEYRSELPAIERLLLGMKPNRQERKARLGYTYSTDGLLQKIRTIQEQGVFRTTTGLEMPTKELAGFMYKINFLIARKELNSGYIDRKYFEDNRYLSSAFADFGYEWEIHPAYRWALQPEDPSSIFDHLRVSNDD